MPKLKTEKCRFRFQRGSLSESLQTSVEIGSKQELCNLINKEFSYLGYNCSIDDIKIKFYAKDDRIPDWQEQYIVTIKNKGVVGFSDRLL